MANKTAGELRLAAFTALLIALTAAQAQAQPAFAQPQTNYGGQPLLKMVPHQPDWLYSPSPQDQTPFYLDQCPEFCQPIDAYGNGPVILEQPVQTAEQQILAGYRNGIFQKLFFTGTYIPALDGDSFGISSLEAGIVFGLPFFQRTTPLLITPRFAVHYFDSPAGVDLPSRVYDADVTFRHLRKFGDGPWAMNAAVTLGQYSDFESSDADAFRVTGQAFAVYESSPATQWIFGVVYLNRENLSVVPAFGVIYEPTPDVIYEAILPRPRISWRLPGDALGSGSERWVYVGGEFGGGIWSIDRPATVGHDVLTYTDYRVLVGVERKITGGLTRRLEAGYVFGRELDFASATSTVKLDDSLFVRGGLTF